MENLKIMICGNVAGCGKSTMAKYLETQYDFKEFSFAEPIYYIAYNVFRMKKKDRSLLQNIGEKMREIDPDVWVKYTYSDTDLYIEDFNIVISDLRRKNEFDAGIEKGFIPVRIVCDRDIAIKRIEERDGSCDVSLLDHDAEVGTRDLILPQIINNGSFTSFYDQIDEFVKSLKQGKE